MLTARLHCCECKKKEKKPAVVLEALPGMASPNAILRTRSLRLRACMDKALWMGQRAASKNCDMFPGQIIKSILCACVSVCALEPLELSSRPKCIELGETSSQRT